MAHEVAIARDHAMQGKFWGRVLWLCLFILGVSSHAFAQAPPDSASAFPMGPGSAGITFTACQSSDQANCYLDFSLYRSPPGFNQQPVQLTSVNANLATHTIYDTTVKPGQTYTYQVCAGGYANSDHSNCLATNSVKIPMQPPSNSGSGSNSGNSGNNGNNGTSIWSPPQNLQVTAGTAAVYLKWINPPKQASPPPTSITIFRDDGTGYWQSIAALDQAANHFKLNTSYADAGPLLPHSSYRYAVCEGLKAQYWNNCATSKFVGTGGATPVLTATRATATTVKLGVAVDNIFGLSEISITREGSDDPCRKGTTLGNGLQGCSTRGPNGMPAGNVVTVADLKNGMGSNSTSAPWVVNVPDDTVKPGVEYYYQAHVTWVGPTESDSEIVTVPSTYATAPSSRVLASGAIKPINTPVPPPTPVGMRTAPAPMRAGPAAVTASNRTSLNLEAAISAVQQKPGDAGALYALGQAYCAARVRTACVNYLYMGLFRAQKAGDATLTAAIQSSLAAQGSAMGASKTQRPLTR